MNSGLLLRFRSNDYHRERWKEWLESRGRQPTDGSYASEAQ
jgi:hypothetical protein